MKRILYILILLYAAGATCALAGKRNIRNMHFSLTSDQIHRAAARFSIRPDKNALVLPDIFLSSLNPAHTSLKNNLRKAVPNNRTYFRINRQLYSNGLGFLRSGKIDFKLNKTYSRFVAVIGMHDQKSTNASAEFEVLINSRAVYSSGIMHSTDKAKHINLKLPRHTKTITLSVKNLTKNATAVWANAGLTAAPVFPFVSEVSVCLPKELQENTEIVITDKNNRIKASTVYFYKPNEPVKILFDSSQAYTGYNIYILPKSSAPKRRPMWQPNAGLILHRGLISRQQLKGKSVLKNRNQIFSQAKQISADLVQQIHHATESAYQRNAAKDTHKNSDLSLYLYTGCFRANKSGTYVFYISSLWDSYLLINNKPIVNAPGKHGFYNGIRGKYRGSCFLQQGIHRIMYINTAPENKMMCMTAWKQPKSQVKIMTSSDFIPVGHYHVDQADTHRAKLKHCLFQWHVQNDFYADSRDNALVQMHFNAPESLEQNALEYIWLFDDGVSIKARTCDHVFLRPALRQVRLKVYKNGRKITELQQQINVRPVWNNLSSNINTQNQLLNIMQKANYSNAPMDDILNAADTLNKAGMHTFKQIFTDILYTRRTELIKHNQGTDLCMDLARDLMKSRRFTWCLNIYQLIAENTSTISQQKSQAMLMQAKLLLEYFNRPNQALELCQTILKNTNQTYSPMLACVYAESLTALNQKESAEKYLSMYMQQKPLDLKLRITQTARLRRIDQLIHGKCNFQDLARANELISKILHDNPETVMHTPINIARMIIYIRQKQYTAALSIAERMQNLHISEPDKPKILYYKLLIYCALKDAEQALKINDKLKQDYPLSSFTSKARARISTVFI